MKEQSLSLSKTKLTVVSLNSFAVVMWARRIIAIVGEDEVFPEDAEDIERLRAHFETETGVDLGSRACVAIHAEYSRLNWASWVSPGAGPGSLWNEIQELVNGILENDLGQATDELALLAPLWTLTASE